MGTRPAGPKHPEALLVLADGTVFSGRAFGALGAHGAIATGELVFNTVMAGYQEVITDPSYAGQVVAFTYPHIGNYGVNAADEESEHPQVRAIVVRDLVDRPSSWRAESNLEDYLAAHGLGGIAGVDTRRLTRHLREAGAMCCALGVTDEATLLAAARAEPGTEGQDLVRGVTTKAPYRAGSGPLSVVALDYGIKRSIVAGLAEHASVEVVPATTPASEVLARHPDGVFLSNGPGDPAALGGLVAELRQLIGKVPIFGICLGHQLLASALGGTTYKLAFGHHGGNHPVKRLANGVVEVTSQNHGYAVAADSVHGAEVTHVNLNDGVIEGLAAPQLRCFSVQYHPEASPGPHDARYLFAEFVRLMEGAA
ncbi:MAG: glutamine-hydrolyzing carbamoyl-phosphate synthase small subunit [Actinomycetota bacterium]|nr:glutamine-hydrolyzing carbamoyl-phosphate synthase small subunit [Actinomycetota bacterium]